MFTRSYLADVAEAQANLGLVWSPGSSAEKYKMKFWPYMGKGKWSWCGAFVTWCCEASDLVMPVHCPSKFGYTFALVEAWQQWAEEKGFYFNNDGNFVPVRGDISVFDWTRTNLKDPDNNWESHIGVHLKIMGKDFFSAEGNTLGGQTAVRSRQAVKIQGWIRIPNAYTF